MTASTEERLARLEGAYEHLATKAAWNEFNPTWNASEVIWNVP